jgi:hypothetical protein
MDRVTVGWCLIRRNQSTRRETCRLPTVRNPKLGNNVLITDVSECNGQTIRNNAQNNILKHLYSKVSLSANEEIRILEQLLTQDYIVPVVF